MKSVDLFDEISALKLLPITRSGFALSMGTMRRGTSKGAGSTTGLGAGGTSELVGPGGVDRLDSVETEGTVTVGEDVERVEVVITTT